MKKFIPILSIAALFSLPLFTAAQGAVVKGKNGGGAVAEKKHVEVKSKKGGGMNIDKHGLEIKNKNGNGLSIQGKKK